MSKKLYIRLLEEEVCRLTSENQKLSRALSEAKKTPLDREVERASAAFSKSMFGIEQIIDNSDSSDKNI